jgi:hypothetical protein
MVHAVTANGAEAVCAGYVVSLATNVPAPAVAPLGIVNRHAKAPAAVVVIVEPANVQVALVDPLGVMVTPSNVTATLEDPAKPAPRAVAVELIRPLDGPIVSDQGVTVYGAL